MTHQDNQRAAFEAWAKTDDMPLGMYSDTDYTDGATQLSWDAWQAAIAHDRQQRGEPVAFAYELGARLVDGEYSIWSPRLTFGMPNEPDGRIRNLTWLYAAQVVKDSLTVAEPVKECRSPYCECEKGKCSSGRIDMRGVPLPEPVAGERFVRAWINLDKLPGTMMVGPKGRFGPIAASTSCWITTSEREAERLKERGPVLEIWTTSQPAVPAQPSVPELTSTIVNEAAWKFVEAMPHNLPGPIFNDLKPALYAAICHVLTTPPADGQPLCNANTQRDLQRDAESAADGQAQQDIETLLKDPAVVHQNMLLGKIAKIDMLMCAHTHGAEMVQRWREFEAHQDADKVGTQPLTRQDIVDRFAFLEGLVNEHTYRKIAEAAISIYEQAQPDPAMAGAEWLIEISTAISEYVPSGRERRILIDLARKRAQPASGEDVK